MTIATLSLLSSTAVLSLTVSSATPAKPSDRSAELAKKVQRFYEDLRDFETNFIQTYTRPALSRTSESAGKLVFKKGGKFHWLYKQPAKKLFIADGETLWIYEPEEQQVIVDRSFSTEKFGGSLSFLWGEGSLIESFKISLEETDILGKNATVLKLVPQKDATYKQVLLRIDPSTGQVNASIVYETSGNTNKFEFLKPKFNQGIEDTLFEFVPPEDVEIVETQPQ